MLLHWKWTEECEKSMKETKSLYLPLMPHDMACVQSYHKGVSGLCSCKASTTTRVLYWSIHGKSFLIMADTQSKWAEVIEMVSATAAQMVVSPRNLFATHQHVISDYGTQLNFQTNGIKHSCYSPCHPATNGEAERFVSTFKVAMKARVDTYSSTAEFLIVISYDVTWNNWHATMWVADGLCSVHTLGLAETQYCGQSSYIARNVWRSIIIKVFQWDHFMWDRKSWLGIFWQGVEWITGEIASRKWDSTTTFCRPKVAQVFTTSEVVSVSEVSTSAIVPGPEVKSVSQESRQL